VLVPLAARLDEPLRESVDASKAHIEARNGRCLAAPPTRPPAAACATIDAVEDTWVGRDLPVLTYLVERLDRLDVHRVDLPEIEQATGLASDNVARALQALDQAEPPLIQGIRAMALPYPAVITGFTERARRAVGAWPTPDGLVDRLMSALDTAADEEVDPSRKSKLREIAGALGGSMREVVVEVAGTAIARGMGM